MLTISSSVPNIGRKQTGCSRASGNGVPNSDSHWPRTKPAYWNLADLRRRTRADEEEANRELSPFWDSPIIAVKPATADSPTRLQPTGRNSRQACKGRRRGLKASAIG